MAKVIGERERLLREQRERQPSWNKKPVSKSRSDVSDAAKAPRGRSDAKAAPIATLTTAQPIGFKAGDVVAVRGVKGIRKSEKFIVKRGSGRSSQKVHVMTKPNGKKAKPKTRKAPVAKAKASAARKEKAAKRGAPPEGGFDKTLYQRKYMADMRAAKKLGLTVKAYREGLAK